MHIDGKDRLPLKRKETMKLVFFGSRKEEVIISNTRERVSSHFQTRRKVDTSRCLEM